MGRMGWGRRQTQGVTAVLMYTNIQIPYVYYHVSHRFKLLNSRCKSEETHDSGVVFPQVK